MYKKKSNLDNFAKSFFSVSVLIIFLITNTQTALAVARTNPFTIGQTIDPGAELTEPCGPTDTNCFVAVLGADDEGAPLTGNVLRFNFVGAGVTATNSSGTITVTVPGGTSGLSDGTILIGNASNVATEQSITGDAAISNAGVLTIANSAVTLAKLATDAVNSAKIVNGSVALADLAGDSIDSSKIVDATITNADVSATAAIIYSKLNLNNAIVLADLTADSVNSSKIIDGSIVAADLATDAVTSVKILDGTITNADISASAAISLSKLASGTDGQIIIANAGGTPVYVAISGDATITNAGALTIANLAITNAKLANSAVTSAKILDGEIVNADISSSAAIAYAKLNLSSSILTGDIIDGTIITADLSDNSIATAKIIDANITTAKLADTSVTTAKLVDTSVILAKLASDSVDSSKIVDATIVTADLADNSISSAKIIDGAVITIKILDGNITLAKLASDSVNSAKIVDGSIATVDLADGSITTLKLAIDAVTTTKILDANITLAKLASDSVDSSKIVNDSIVNADINASANIALSKLANGANIVTSLGAPTGSNANGGSITSNVLTLSLADGTNPGLVSTGTQTFAGDKTLTGATALNGSTLRSGNTLTFNNAANTFGTSLVAGSNSANLALTLPVTDGADGTALMTNGSGVLTFRNPYAFIARVASTSNAALTTAYEDGDTLDGVTLATGNIIILSGQSMASENGVYTVNASGAPTRLSNSQINGQQTFVVAGTANTSKTFILASANTYATAAAGASSPITIANVSSLFSTGLTNTGLSSVATNSVFLGENAGNSATNADTSNFFGPNAGANATNATNSNFFGDQAGALAASAYSSNFLGYLAGAGATNANNSHFLGSNAGNGAADASNSNFLGANAGASAVNADHSNFLGQQAGENATNAQFSNFLGNSTGNSATNASYSNFLGASAGLAATNAAASNFFGAHTGEGATNASNSSFFGNDAGKNATNAANSLFIGTAAGNADTVNNTASANDFSILLGNQTSTGGFSNSIAIGKSATNTATNQLMLGSSTRGINQIVNTGALAVNSGAASALTLDSGTTGNVNVGTGANAKTITVGNNTGASTINLTSGTGGITASSTTATGNTLAVTADSLTSGKGLSLASSATALTGDLQNITLSGDNVANTGNLLKLDITGASSAAKALTITNAGTGLSANIQGALALQKGTDFSTTGQSDNVAFSNASLIRLTGASTQTISGIAGGTDGKILTIVNAASQAAVISNQSSSSTAANRIITGTGSDYTMSADTSSIFVYDSGASRWRMVSGAGSASGVSYSSTDIADIAGGGSIGSAAATVDAYTNFNVTQTTVGQTLSLPNPTNTTSTKGKVITVNNTGTANFILGGVTLPAGSYGSAYVWSGLQWQTINAASNVVSEYGETNTVVNTTVSGSIGSQDTILNVTIPSAGTWEINAAVSISDSADGASHFGLFDSGTIVPNTETLITLTNGVAGGTWYQTGHNSWIVTTTGPKTYTVGGWDGNAAGSYSVDNSSFGRTKATWKKIAGNTASVGQSVDYLNVKRTSAFVVNGTPDIPFNSVLSGNIPYNTSTGEFTLSAGKTYVLRALASVDNTTAGSYFEYQWRDSTGVFYGNLGSTYADNALVGYSQQSQAEAVITPTATMVLTVRISNAVNNSNLRGNSSYATIQQLGSSGIVAGSPTVFNQLSDAAGSGTVNNSNFSQTWNWNTATTQNALVLSANALTSGSLQNLSTSSTAFTGNLSSLSSTGNNSAVTGSVLNLDVQGATSAAKALTITNAGTGLSANIAGAIALKAGTDYTTPGSANDVALGNASLIRLDTSAGAQTITGIAGGADGKILTLMNTDAALAVTLSNNSGSSVAANRIITGTGADLSLSAGASVNLQYDSANSLWRVVGGSGAATKLSGLAAANATNTIDNLNFTQTWNWSTATTQNGLSLSANALTSGKGISLVSSSTGLTSGNLLNITSTGAATSATGFIADISNTAATSMAGLLKLSTNATSFPTSGVSITGTGARTSGSGTLFNITDSSTTGNVASISAPSLTGGKALIVQGSSSMTSGGQVLAVDTLSATTGQAIAVTNTGAYTANGLVGITANSATLGTLLTISGNALTSGSGLTVNSGSNALTGSLQKITLSGDNAANTGNLLNLSSTGANSLATGLSVDTSVSGGLAAKFAGAIAFKAGTDQATTGTTLNDLAVGNTSLVRFTGSTAATVVTGIKAVDGTNHTTPANEDGRLLTIMNTSTVAMTIADAAVTGLTSTTGNRIITGTGGDLALAVDASVFLQYDATGASGAGRWRVVGGSGSGGSSTIATCTTTATCTTALGGVWGKTLLVDATAGTVTVNLPTAVGNSGKAIEVKKTDSSVNAVIIDPSGAQTVDGGATYTLAGQNASNTFRSDNVNVQIISNTFETAAEYGNVIVTNQVFSTNSFVNSTNGIYDIPSAGTWVLRYDLATDGTGANTNSQFGIFDSSSVILAGTEKTRGGSVTIAAPLTAEITVVTTGATTYRLKGRNGGSGSVTILNGGNNDSTISWQKISGYLPISGQSVDYFSAHNESTNTGGSGIQSITQTNVTNLQTVSPAGNRVTISANNTGNLVQSGNVITIVNAGAYRISGTVTYEPNTLNVVFLQAVKNGTTVLSTSGTNSTSGDKQLATVDYIANLVAGDTIDFRFNGNSTAVAPLYAYTVSIAQIGSSAFTAGTNLNFNSLYNAVAAGSLDNTNFAQTWDWSTATTQTALAMSANVLTTGTLQKLTTTSTALTGISGVAGAGSLLDINATGAATAFVGNLANIQNTGLTAVGNTGTALNINLSGTAQIMKALKITDASTGALGTATGSGAVNFNFTGAHTGNAVQIDDVTTTGNTLAVNTGTQDGVGVNVNVNSLSLGYGLNVASTATGIQSSGSVANIQLTGNNAANFGSVLSLSSTGALSNATTLKIVSAQTGGTAMSNTSSATTGTAESITTNALTTGKALIISSSATGITTAGANAGSLFDITASGALTAMTGSIASISNTGASTVGATGNLLNLNLSGAAQIMKGIKFTTASTGNLGSPNTTGSGGVNFTFSGAHTGSAFQIDDVTSTGGGVFQVNATGLTSGIGVNVQTAALTSGFTMNVNSGSPNITSAGANNGSLANFNSNGAATAFTGQLVSVNFTGGNAAGNTGSLLNLVNTGANNVTKLATLTTDTLTGNALNITASGAYTGTGLVTLTANNLTTGKGQTQSYNGLTTGTGFGISSSATGITTAGANIGSLFDITESGAMTAMTGSIANINLSGANTVGSTGNALNINIAGTAQIMKALQITSASTGNLSSGGVNFTFSGAHTGAGVQISDASVSGNALVVNGNSNNTGVVTQINGNNTTTGITLQVHSGVTSGDALLVDGSATSNTNLVRFTTVATGATTDILKLQYANKAGVSLASTNKFIRFEDNVNTVLGSITGASGTNPGVVYSTVSDARMKHNITETALGLSDLMGLSVRDYTFNGSPETSHQTGFIAQELNAIFPDAVATNGDNGLVPLGAGVSAWSVDYGRVTPLIVKAVQDMNFKVENGMNKVAQADLAAWTEAGTITTHIDAIKNSPQRNVVAYFTTKMSEGYKFVTDFASEKITVITGYFDTLFAKEAIVETLCVGTKDNKTCITKAQLDALLGGSGNSSTPPLPAPAPTPVLTPDSNTNGSEGNSSGDSAGGEGSGDITGAPAPDPEPTTEVTG